MSPWICATIYCGLIIAMALAMVVTSYLLGPRRPGTAKLDTYECGMPVLSSPRERFNVHFYLIAIFFILFDIEIVFLVPYAVLYRKLGVVGLVEAAVFVGILGYGLAYLWKRGALEWD